MELVKIQEKMIEEADAYQSKINKTRTLRRRSNFTALQAKERYFFGYLGEVCFAYWLREAGKSFKWTIRTDGIGTKFKFWLPRSDGGGIHINVVTASKPFHSLLAIPENKLRFGSVDAFVGARLNMETLFCELFGYATPRMMFEEGSKNLGRGTPAYSLSLLNLKPLTDLIARVEDDVKAGNSIV